MIECIPWCALCRYGAPTAGHRRRDTRPHGACGTTPPSPTAPVGSPAEPACVSQFRPSTTVDTAASGRAPTRNRPPPTLPPCPDDCVRWRGPVDRLGYPRTKVLGPDGTRRSAYAHRVEYEFAVRPLRPGERVYRTCGDRLCINVDHMTTEPQGRPPATARLTARKAENVRRLWASDPRPTQGALARRYGVSRSAISLVVRGKTWAP